MLIMDVLGEDRLDQILQSARAAASNGRERRQVEALGLTADYWKQAARFYRLKDKANAAADKGDKQEAEDINKQAEAQLKLVMACVDRLPRGYVGAGVNELWLRELPKS